MSDLIQGTSDNYISRMPAGKRKAAAEKKYVAAVQLYAATNLTIKEIAKLCKVTAAGLSAHISKYHRPLLFARYGLELESYDKIKVKPSRGQSLKSYKKYKNAIEACSDLAYIEYNVSQVGRFFEVDGRALASQLRVHYPGVIEWREEIRRRLGIADNVHRGARNTSKDEYSKALEIYRDTDMTIQEVAECCNVSYSGLTRFLRFYHKDIIKSKYKRRKDAKKEIGLRKPGALAANGNTYGPKQETIAKYARALELYSDTCMTIAEIAKATNVSEPGFRGYIHQWHRGERLRRRGYDWDGESVADLKDTRHFLKSTAGKYAAAIASLKENPRPVAKVAAEFGHNPEVFREYLKNHEPELTASLGMTRTTDGKLTKQSSAEKYRDAIQEFATSTDTLKSIAERHGIVYNSICGYVMRNCHKEREQHRLLVEKSKNNKLNK